MRSGPRSQFVTYKKIEQKPLTLGESLYLPAIGKGLALTLKHFFSKPDTMQYPEQKWTLPEYYRGASFLMLGGRLVKLDIPGTWNAPSFAILYSPTATNALFSSSSSSRSAPTDSTSVGQP